MPTVTVKLPPGLARRLRLAVARRATTQSAFIREALEARLESTSDATPGSFLDLAGDLAGSVRGGPSDLSWNKRHLKGFGR
jgi:predicted DNA-binding protein